MVGGEAVHPLWNSLGSITCPGSSGIISAPGRSMSPRIREHPLRDPANIRRKRQYPAIYQQKTPGDPPGFVSGDLGFRASQPVLTLARASRELPAAEHTVPETGWTMVSVSIVESKSLRTSSDGASTRGFASGRALSPANMLQAHRYNTA